MNPGGGGCSEPSSCHWTLVWQKSETLSQKQKQKNQEIEVLLIRMAIDTGRMSHSEQKSLIHPKYAYEQGFHWVFVRLVRELEFVSQGNEGGKESPQISMYLFAISTILGIMCTDETWHLKGGQETFSS